VVTAAQLYFAMIPCAMRDTTAPEPCSFYGWAHAVVFLSLNRP
jgi:hypothetical protein